jgi:alpha-1,2-mannosyltransferase
MGYAFAVATCKFLLPSVPTAAYVHYPTISTDMLGSLDTGGQGVNAGQGAGLRGFAKRKYWHLFARLYGWVGGKIDVVMTNSNWTANHIRKLWGPHRKQVAQRDPNSELSDDVSVVFPPCPVHEIEAVVPLDPKDETPRHKDLIYVAQFRPEKNHTLVLKAFAHLLANYPPSPQASPTKSGNETSTARNDATEKPKLILLGSVRDPDDKTRVYQLRLLAHELGIKNNVEFVLDAPWSQIESLLRTSWVGINAMWNEHFGIGVVEYQAAGLICVVNSSGGPKYDIVIDEGDGPTGKPSVLL